jgi:hypothetical protein
MIRNTVKDFEFIRITDFLKPDADDFSEEVERLAPSLLDKRFNEVDFIKWSCKMSEKIGEEHSLDVGHVLYSHKTITSLYLHTLNKRDHSTGIAKSFMFQDGEILDSDKEDEFREFEQDILNGKYK